MNWTVARDTHRVLLGAALVVKGLTWPAAPREVSSVLVIAGIVALAGRWTRAAFGLAAAVIWVTFATGSYRSNHFALMALLTTIAVLMGDPERARRDDLGIHLTMVQVSTVYVFAAVWKVNAEFLSGAVLDYEWGESWLLGPGASPAWFRIAAAVGTILGEVLLVVLLRGRRTVRLGVGLGVVLHLGMILTIGAARHTTGELVAFALLCGSSYPFFIARSQTPPRRAASRRRRRPRDRAATSARAATPATPA